MISTRVVNSHASQDQGGSVNEWGTVGVRLRRSIAHKPSNYSAPGGCHVWICIQAYRFSDFSREAGNLDVHGHVCMHILHVCVHVCVTYIHTHVYSYDFWKQWITHLIKYCGGQIKYLGDPCNLYVILMRLKNSE